MNIASRVQSHLWCSKYIISCEVLSCAKWDHPIVF